MDGEIGRNESRRKQDFHPYPLFAVLLLACLLSWLQESAFFTARWPAPTQGWKVIYLLRERNMQVEWIPLKWSTGGTWTYILHGYVLYPQAVRQKSPSATRSEGWAPCRKVWIQYRTWRHLHSSFDLALFLLLSRGTEGSANLITHRKCSVADVVNWHFTARLQLCFLLTTVRFLLQCFTRKMVGLQQTFVSSDRHSQADYSGFTERHFLSRRGRQHVREVPLSHCKQTRWFWGRYLYAKVLLYHEWHPTP